MNMVEQVLSIVFMAVAVAILVIVAIGALIMLCISIYDAWFDRRCERKEETK